VSDTEPHALPTPWQVAGVAFDALHWRSRGSLANRAAWLPLAEEVCALFPGRTEAAVKAELLRSLAADLLRQADQLDPREADE